MVTQEVRFLLPAIVCQTLKIKKMKLKNKYRFLVDWTLFNTFLTPDKLTDLVQINPANFKKKGCEKPSFLLISCITKIAKDLAGVDG